VQQRVPVLEHKRRLARAKLLRVELDRDRRFPKKTLKGKTVPVHKMNNGLLKAAQGRRRRGRRLLRPL
jgi:hypothetical protein